MDKQRRRMLAALGSASVGMLAGCNDSSDSSKGEVSPPSEQVAKLVPEEEEVDGLWRSIALSSDGSTAIIGAYHHTSGSGLYMFDQSDGSWSQETPPQTDDIERWTYQFGSYTAISGDGSTALISTRNDESYSALFNRSGNSWNYQRDFEQSNPTAVSDDGSTIIAGTEVFAEADGTWSREAKLVEEADAAALSGDGSTAVIANSPGAGDGKAYIFERVDDSWSNQHKITQSKGSFGGEVDISRDGSTALIGGDNWRTPVFVLAKSDGSWTQQSKLNGGKNASNFFGESVAVSDDGSVAIVGARSNEDSNGEKSGAAFIFERTGESWSQGSKLVTDDPESGGNFGCDVALSGDGSTALIGDTGDCLAYVYK